MTNLGAWDRWYVGLTTDEPQAYGDQMSYALAADFLADCETVEDWGCGKGWFRTLRNEGYVGVDGSSTPFADRRVDLTEYTSSADGVLLRHVLEHNYNWQAILDNATATAQKKLCIILFTPLGEVTQNINFSEDIGVPDISFRLEDITRRMQGLSIEMDYLRSNTQYGEETLIYGRC